MHKLTLRVLLLLFCIIPAPAIAQQTQFHVLAFWSTTVEKDHVMFAQQAMQFYSALAKRDGFEFAATTNWDDLNATRLAQVQVVLWLDDSRNRLHSASPSSNTCKAAEAGWVSTSLPITMKEPTGHGSSTSSAAQSSTATTGRRCPPCSMWTTRRTQSPGIFRHSSSRRPTSGISGSQARALNKDVKVLLTLDKSNYPIGLKDTLRGGDIPVVWTNTKYRMIYMNMGHGDKIFTDAHTKQALRRRVTLAGRQALKLTAPSRHIESAAAAGSLCAQSWPASAPAARAGT